MPSGVYVRKNKKTPQELREKRDKYQKKFREDPIHAQKAAEEAKKYALNPKRMEYRKNYREARKEYEKIFRQQKKSELFDTMGGKCSRCGFSDYRALQIDHINGDGAKDKELKISNGNPYFKKVLDSFVKKEGRYQLLCSNCNWIKRFENNEHIKRQF